MICVSSYDSWSCDYCDKNPDRQIDIIKTIINFFHLCPTHWFALFSYAQFRMGNLTFFTRDQILNTKININYKFSFAFLDS